MSAAHACREACLRCMPACMDVRMWTRAPRRAQPGSARRVPPGHDHDRALAAGRGGAHTLVHTTPERVNGGEEGKGTPDVSVSSRRQEGAVRTCGRLHTDHGPEVPGRQMLGKVASNWRRSPGTRMGRQQMAQAARNRVESAGAAAGWPPSERANRAAGAVDGRLQLARCMRGGGSTSGGGGGDGSDGEGGALPAPRASPAVGIPVYNFADMRVDAADHAPRNGNSDGSAASRPGLAAAPRASNPFAGGSDGGGGDGAAEGRGDAVSSNPFDARSNPFASPASAPAAAAAAAPPPERQQQQA
eukprot:322277-Chlamydomonas_euryale.AAC.1